ncbi:Flotillin-1, partial [Fragariocoptes setiger]
CIMPRFVTCGPNEAIIVSGCCHSNPLMVPGGRVFVWPLFHRIQRISLNTMTLEVSSAKVYSEGGVPVTVKGVAQVKIQGKDLASLRAATEMFLDKAEDEIMDIARATLEGHQRSIIASMPIQSIYQKRKEFSTKVGQSATSDLIDMGLTLVSYTVQDISDTEGYLAALGQEKTIDVKTSARKEISKATASAKVDEIESEKKRLMTQAQYNATIAEAKRNFEISKAEYDGEVYRKKAESDLAETLQSAITRQTIVREQMEAKLAEREKESELLEKKIQQKLNELKAKQEVRADAEYFRKRVLAEAHKIKAEKEAQAHAEAIRIKAQAEADVVRKKGEAHAEQLRNKALAFKEYQNAAKIEMVLAMLPRVTAEISAPLAQCNSVRVVSQDGTVGFAKITNEIFGVINQLGSAVGQLTSQAVSSSTGDITQTRRPSSSDQDKGLPSRQPSTLFGTMQRSSRS